VAQSWHSLYLPATEVPEATSTLLDVLESTGYTRYDPFPGGMGTPPGLKTFVKLFVTPAQEGWVRVLGEPDPAVLPDLSRQFKVLYAYLYDKRSSVSVYRDGSLIEDGLIEFLRPGKTADDLARAAQGAIPTIAGPSTQSASMLPEEFQQLAQDH